MFLHKVIHNKYIFFLSINGSRPSEATITVEDLVKNGHSGRHLISQTKLVLLFEFCMWKILSIEEDCQTPKALERMQSTYSYLKYYPKF